MVFLAELAMLEEPIEMLDGKPELVEPVRSMMAIYGEEARLRDAILRTLSHIHGTETRVAQQIWARDAVLQLYCADPRLSVRRWAANAQQSLKRMPVRIFRQDEKRTFERH